MKKIIALSVAALLLTACGDDKAEATTNSSIPADCQSYISAVEKLVAKAPAAGKQFEQALAASKEQWEKLSDDQAEAANASCKQMLEQIKPML